MAGIATGSSGEIRADGADRSNAQTEAARREIEKKAYTAVMNSEWKEVVDIYEKDKSAPTTINRVGDTVLHLAILMGDPKGVIELMELMEEKDSTRMEKILQTENDWGNTPLHQAAFMGLDEVCSFIARKYCTEKVVLARNKLKETPLHVAVLHGQKSAFFALQMVFEDKGWKADDRREGGDTILHSAIFREHFALEIIDIYPDLMNSINERGESALHILANKPSAFKSGAYLNLAGRSIYYIVPVKVVQLEYPTYKKNGRQDLQDDRKACDARWTNGNDDKSQRIIDVEISEEGVNKRNQAKQENTVIQNQGIPLGSPNQHQPFFNIFNQVLKAIIFLLLHIENLPSLLPHRDPISLLADKVKEIQEKKRKNKYAHHIMKKLVSGTQGWQFQKDGGKPNVKGPISEMEIPSADQQDSKHKKKQHPEQQNSETEKAGSPFLVAAMKGVIEMVTEILDISPVAAFDVDSNGKSIVLLAAEYRQTHIYKHMLTKGIMKLYETRKVTKVREALFRRVDNQGNSALHLAAKFTEKQRSWNIQGAALQMQSEIKWYKYIEKSMKPGFFIQYNFERKTAEEIFTDTHKELVKGAREWFISTSQSCSVVAALIATVAYTSATTVPGGSNEDSGVPLLEKQFAFQVFAMSSLIALCSSVTALVLFLSILTSRFYEWDFDTGLPMKLIGGMTAFFLSITANLVSFCAGHFFVIHDMLRYRVYYIYAGLSLPVMLLFFASQFRLCFDLMMSLFSVEPQKTGVLQFF